MDTIPVTYLTRAEIALALTTLVYFLMNGAQLFETLVLVPKWTAAPPDSFRWLADKNGTSLKTFWIVFHSVHELTFILALACCWKLGPVRNGLLILLFLHIMVRAWTLAYFAPNIIVFQRLAETGGTAANLIEKARQWQLLNYVRVAVYVIISIGLIPLFVRLLSLKGQ